MQFINISLEKLVKNLSGNDFKYLTEYFGSKNFILTSTWTVLIDCNSVKDGTFGDNGERVKGTHHISDKYYLTCNKIWNEFKIKNMVDYHDHCLKIMFCY